MTEAAVTAPAKAKPRAAQARRRGRLRIALILLGPLLLIAVGAWLYLSGGRYVSTDDAYVKAGITDISSDVNGRVVDIAVHDDEAVKAGRLLFRLNDAPYRYALDRTKAQLESTRLEIDALRATYAQKQSDLKAAQQSVEFQIREFERQNELLSRHVASQAQFDQAQHNLDMARQSLESTRQALANILASLGGNANLATDGHPRVLAAKSAVDQAELDLSHTIVKAPADGVVANVSKLQTGAYVTAATPLFSLIGTELWVEANFKETDLTHMQPGQEASVDIDAYPGHVFTGRILGISPGTGAEFSVLPAQNATGNWVKVVQRVPVRVAITEDAGLALRAGMSATVEIDTKHRRPMSAMLDSAFAGTPQQR